MTTGLGTNIRRLPGLRFEAQSPPLADSLPRMDIAVFVGFAASGPINQPVVIEDSAQFAAIFGEDAPLSWDADRSTTVHAYLGPAVREFFRQGGRRCWIIRVARDAKYNYFAVPALLEQRSNGELLPAFARARSEGSWSDGLRVGTSLLIQPVEVTSASFAEHRFELSPNSPGDVRPGDLLRFNLRDEGYGLFGVVYSTQAVDPSIGSPPSEGFTARQRRAARRRSVIVECNRPLWFSTHWLDGLSRERISPVSRANEDGSSGPLLEHLLNWSLSNQGENITLRFEPGAVVPEAGAKLLVDWFDAQLQVTIEPRANDELDSPLQETPQASGRVERLILPPPSEVLVFNEKGESRAIPVTGRATLERGRIRLDCAVALAEAPEPGTVIEVVFGLRRWWLTVGEAISITDPSSTSPTGSVQLEGSGFWLLPGPPVVSPETAVEAERLNFELLVREASDEPRRLSELGFDEQHPRYWGAWPTDDERYQGLKTLAFVANVNASEAARREVFPLADSHDDNSLETSGRELYLPVAMPFFAGPFLGAVEQPQAALERDGLAVFDSDLFLDAELIDTSLEDLLSKADYLRYQSPAARSLRGIHAALDIEEATIIAVPDAVHRGWTSTAEAEVTPAVSELLAHPKWWRYLDCNAPQVELKRAPEPSWENFLDCNLRVIAAPTWLSASAANGTIALLWSAIDGATQYVVEESRSASWNGAEVIYSGAETKLVIYGRSAGDYFYRVRAVTADATSDWSAGKNVRASSTNQWLAEKKEAYKVAPLLDVQRALLRFCAARADLFAILALPEHYREDDAITHAELLRPANDPLSRLTPLPTGELRVAPLSSGEERATSYGTVYHPWLINRRDDLLQPWQVVPPDGAASGVLAQRALTRGAWHAPANELLRGVVALAPPLAASRRLDLQDAQVNIFRHEPRGFLSLSADTLSRDIDLRPINVRRLLILVRRLALRLGDTYVFEPNDDSFRRMVQRGFEAALDAMFVRGAFAGRTAATSYQVVTDQSINTAASIDQGRFIVELRVAPSLPLTFITVRLIQTNDRSAVTEVR